MLTRIISLPVLTMGAWAGLLTWLLFDERYQFFLAPRFGILIASGAIFALLFALSLTARTIRRDKNHAVKGMFLVLPIFFILSAGDGTLGSFALSKRPMTAALPRAGQMPANLPDSTPQPGDDAPLISIKTLVFGIDTYENRRIRLDGIFSGTVDGHDELSAVFRYYITCCAADALPVGIFMDSHSPKDLSDNDWVRVKGRVHTRRLDGYDIIFMDVESIERQKKPSKHAAYIY